jgi:hypothetical protein
MLLWGRQSRDALATMHGSLFPEDDRHVIVAEANANAGPNIIIKDILIMRPRPRWK